MGLTKCRKILSLILVSYLELFSIKFCWSQMPVNLSIWRRSTNNEWILIFGLIINTKIANTPWVESTLTQTHGWHFVLFWRTFNGWLWTNPWPYMECHMISPAPDWFHLPSGNSAAILHRGIQGLVQGVRQLMLNLYNSHLISAVRKLYLPTWLQLQAGIGSVTFPQHWAAVVKLRRPKLF